MFSCVNYLLLCVWSRLIRYIVLVPDKPPYFKRCLPFKIVGKTAKHNNVIKIHVLLSLTVYTPNVTFHIRSECWSAALCIGSSSGLVLCVNANGTKTIKIELSQCKGSPVQ